MRSFKATLAAALILATSVLAQFADVRTITLDSPSNRRVPALDVAIAAGRITPMIWIFPDGQRNSFYGNAFDRPLPSLVDRRSRHLTLVLECRRFRGRRQDEEDLYLLGTEAPDNRNIPLSCGVPHRGYDDRSRGHSVEWNAAGTQMTNDRAALRAQEEYGKAVIAYEQGEEGHAAFYLGAMAHYIGDVSQYGHSWGAEQHHGDYESWVARRTPGFDSPMFDSYIQLDSLVRRTAFTAAGRVSVSTFRGNDRILTAREMDQLYSTKPPRYIDSIGDSLNLAVNELADVLHTFYVNAVSEED